MGIQLLGPTSTSELDTLKSCPRKFMYRYRDGIVPRGTADVMAIGTIFHQCAAAGYAYGTGVLWHDAAIAHLNAGNFVDRDGLALNLSEDAVDALRDMLLYYYEHVGKFDNFHKIIAVEDEIYFESHGWSIRATMDLVVEHANGDIEVIDHKTSGDISGDQAHLPLDLQTHIYYLAAWRKFGRVVNFTHNYVRRFDLARDGGNMVGPVSFTRPDGTQPYLLTKGGKKRTASDDPNDYVRRTRTPLSLRQLTAFEAELGARLQTMAYHKISDVWPRADNKLGFGCGSCSYYSLCTTEADGREVNPMAFDLSYERLARPV